MPDATITSTASTFGTISGTFAADQSTVTGTVTGIVAGTLTGSVGVPGPQGPAGPGSTWGGIIGTLSAQTDLWTELGTKYLASNPAGYQTAAQVTTALSPYLTTATASATYQTLAGMSSYLTTSAAAAGYYPLSGNPSGFLTAASLSGYATESWVTGQGYITSAALSPYLLSSTAASTYYLQTNPSGFQTAANVTTALSPYLLSATAASTYAPIAAGLPTGGTVGQILTKQSGTNFDASFQTLIPGDRYLTTSTTSNTVGNGNKTFTIGTGLSYTPTQNITISYDASNHMHGEVLTYNSGTGVLTVDINHHTGSGTYTAWVVNVGGVTPATSVAWGSITGTLSSQTDLATALNSKLELSGGVLDANATIEASTTTQASVFSGTGINAALSANPSENVTVNYTGVQVQNGVGTMSVGPAGLTFPNSSVQTVAFPGFNNTTLTGNPIAPTPATSDNDTSIATTAFVKAQGYLTSAPVTSVAGRTGVITLSNTDISGLGSLAVVNDAPSDGSQYARRNAAWEAVAASGASVTISATAPVSPSSGDLWLRTTDYRTFTWTGAQWIESSAGYVSEIGSTFETVSKNLNAYPATLAYSSGLLSTITYNLGGGLTIVKTFNRTGSNLTSIVLSGYTPGGISLTKTLTYSSGNLVGISYS